jgi:hypothetical protein
MAGHPTISDHGVMSRAAQELIIAALGMVEHIASIAYQDLVTDKEIIAALGMARHPLSIAAQDIDPCLAEKLVVAAAGMVGHFANNIAEYEISPCTADEEVIAAAGMVGHLVHSIAD